jgi:4-hydroxy-tetrahydrodipicolinate synthase
MDKYHLDIRDRIKGPVFSILTPFDPETEEIDFNSLERYIQTVYDAGGNIFYVMAYNSRFSQLTFDEIKMLNEFVVKTAKAIDANNIVIVADPPHCSTRISTEFAKHAETVGADLISLIVRERYYSNQQIFTHFKMINDACSIGILIHEMPFLNGLGGPIVQWPLELLDQVADLSNVIAIKEDAKNDDYSDQVVKLLKDRLSIIISGGGKSQWMRFEDKGCQAWLNGIGVFEPRLATSFWRAWNSGNKSIVNKIVNEVEAPFFVHGVKKYGWHLTIKVALESFGHMSKHDRMPLMPLGKKESENFLRKLNKLPIKELII